MKRVFASFLVVPLLFACNPPQADCRRSVSEAEWETYMGASLGKNFEQLRAVDRRWDRKALEVLGTPTNRRQNGELEVLEWIAGSRRTAVTTGCNMPTETTHHVVVRVVEATLAGEALKSCKLRTTHFIGGNPAPKPNVDASISSEVVECQDFSPE